MSGIEIQDEDIRSLATTFEVSESTVRRWRNGVARPMPRMLLLILKEIERLENERRDNQGG